MATKASGKKWKGELKNATPLEYIVFKNVPMRSSKHGDVVDIDLGVLEQLAAKAVVETLLPLRGKEVRFLRKVLGLSYEKFAGPMDLSAATVMKWERAETNRLHLVNEVAVRSFVAERLGLHVDSVFSKLVGGHTPEVLELKAS
jgi:DNA-binding transcriptional regulator YiaG